MRDLVLPCVDDIKDGSLTPACHLAKNTLTRSVRSILIGQYSVDLTGVSQPIVLVTEEYLPREA